MPLHFHIGGGGEGNSSRKAQINADRIAAHGIAVSSAIQPSTCSLRTESGARISSYPACCSASPA